METMEPAETPSQAIKDGFPNDEPDLDWLKLSPKSTFEDGPRLVLESTSQAESHPPTPNQRSLEKAGSKVRVIKDESAKRTVWPTTPRCKPFRKPQRSPSNRLLPHSAPRMVDFHDASQTDCRLKNLRVQKVQKEAAQMTTALISIPRVVGGRAFCASSKSEFQRPSQIP
jgi:hypothetical protein